MTNGYPRGFNDDGIETTLRTIHLTYLKVASNPSTAPNIIYCDQVLPFDSFTQSLMGNPQSLLLFYNNSMR